MLPFAPVVDPDPPDVPPVVVVAAVVPPVLPLPFELPPPELPVPDVDVPVVVPPDVLVEVPPVVLVDVVPEVPVLPPLVAAWHGPWLKLNCPLQLESIIAVAPVTVDPRFKVVV